MGNPSTVLDGRYPVSATVTIALVASVVDRSSSDSPTPLPPPGWYDDPSDRPGLRWWNGTGWTNDISPTAATESISSQLIPIDGRTFVLSGWWRRAGGFILDDLLLLVVALVLQVIVGILAYSDAGAFGLVGGHVTASPASRAVLSVGELAISVGYSVWLLSSRGQTVGMMALGIRLIDEARGTPPTMIQVWRRVILVLLLVTVWDEAANFRSLWTNTTSHADPVEVVLRLVYLALVLTTYLWPLGNPRNQTLQDKGAHTLVVRSD